MEIVSTIRTAHAFGTQSMLASLYDVATQKAYNADCRGAVVHGMGLSCFFFTLYAAYGLGEYCDLLFPTNLSIFLYVFPAFSFGTTLINEGRATPGEIINVFLSVIIGSLSLALMAPELQGTSTFLFLFLFNTLI